MTKLMKSRKMRNVERRILVVFTYWQGNVVGNGNSTEYVMTTGRLTAREIREVEADLMSRLDATRVVIENIIKL